MTKSSALKIAGLAALVIVGFVFLISNVLFPQLQKNQLNKVNEVQNRISELDSEINKLKPSKKQESFDLNTTVENGIKGNRSKLMNYVAAGEAIPQNVWLTYFMTQGDGLVDIKGVSTDVSAVYVFFKNMRDSLIGTKLKLQQLEMDSKSVDAAVSGTGSNYIFEITNMTEGQLGAFSNPEGETNKGDKKEENNSQAESSDQGNSELLGTEPIEE